MSSPSVRALGRTPNYFPAVGNRAGHRKGPVFGPAVHLANICAQTLAILAASIGVWWVRYEITGQGPEFALSTALLFLGLLIGYAVAFAVAADRVFQRDLRATARKSNVTPYLSAIWLCSGLGLDFAARWIDPSASFSAPWITCWLLFTTAGVGATSLTLQVFARRWEQDGRLTQRTALVGGGEHGQRYIEWFARNKERTPDVELVGYYDDRRRRVPTELEGFKYKGTVDDLLAELLSGSIDQVFIALPWSADCRIDEIAQRLRRVAIDVRLVPEMIAFRLAGSSNVSLLESMVKVVRRPISGWSLLLKELFDKVVSGLLLVAFMPVMLLIAIAIKIDDHGPVFFRQRRVGFNNHTIGVWKFRTMYCDRCEHEHIQQARAGDPRVTRVGYWLRRLSLDELPQLFNVLAGEMSIVGPRPHAPSTRAGGRLFDEVIDCYATRHTVKPGITGWAQVSGWRGPTDTEVKLIKRVEYDLYYIENWSIVFDVLILLRTLVVPFNSSNAL
jgi:Undecaprenyl-phosphate glucose phosphotransferase